ICKDKQRIALSDYEFGTVSKRVKKLLENPSTYENLLLKLEGDQQKMREIVKWLLDNKKIIYRVDGLLEWK
ncbi:MAG TPA: hypothetical protein VEP89_03785, partial [Draconibacterium sp.]|nr:hypothetical protein [Draconibacterium sp.]